MIIRPTDAMDVKRKKLGFVPPAMRMAVMERLGRGESVDVTIPQEVLSDPHVPVLTELLKNRKIDLTKNEDLYYAVNRALLPLRQQLGRKIYDPYRKHAATIRKLNDSNNGFTDNHTLRHIAAFPPDIYQAIISQYPNVDERNSVIQHLLKTPEGKLYATVEKGI